MQEDRQPNERRIQRKGDHRVPKVLSLANSKRYHKSRVPRLSQSPRFRKTEKSQRKKLTSRRDSKLRGSNPAQGKSATSQRLTPDSVSIPDSRPGKKTGADKPLGPEGFASIKQLSLRAVMHNILGRWYITPSSFPLFKLTYGLGSPYDTDSQGSMLILRRVPVILNNSRAGVSDVMCKNPRNVGHTTPDFLEPIFLIMRIGAPGVSSWECHRRHLCPFTRR